jgi:mutator protein MutT
VLSFPDARQVADRLTFGLKPVDRMAIILLWRIQTRCNKAKEMPVLDYPIPVVRVILADRQGRVLILRRAEGSAGGGDWCLPGGKIDSGQTAAETVRKELLEETGLRCSAERFLFYQDSLSVPPGDTHYINLYFHCEAHGEVRLDKTESIDHAWVAKERLGDYSIVFGNDLALHRFWHGNQKDTNET